MLNWQMGSVSELSATAIFTEDGQSLAVYSLF